MGGKIEYTAKAQRSWGCSWGYTELGKKTENDLRAMNQILYDMGLLALVRCLLQRTFKFEPPFGLGSELKRVPPTQRLKKISVF